MARADNRKAVLDSATAVEVAIAQVKQKLDEAGGPVATTPKKNRPYTLGQLITELGKRGAKLAVSSDDLRHLTKSRNATIHEGNAPSYTDANRATTAAMTVVTRHGGLAHLRDHPGPAGGTAQDA